MALKLLCVLGTRPEAIKLAPVLKALRARPDQFACRPCLKKAQTLLGYRPRTDLTCGLRRTLSWFHDHLCKIEAAARF